MYTITFSAVNYQTLKTGKYKLWDSSCESLSSFECGELKPPIFPTSLL